jgi:hypothetical protein
MKYFLLLIMLSGCCHKTTKKNDTSTYIDSTSMWVNKDTEATDIVHYYNYTGGSPESIMLGIMYSDRNGSVKFKRGYTPSSWFRERKYIMISKVYE